MPVVGKSPGAENNKGQDFVMKGHAILILG